MLQLATVCGPLLPGSGPAAFTALTSGRGPQTAAGWLAAAGLALVGITATWVIYRATFGWPR